MMKELKLRSIWLLCSVIVLSACGGSSKNEKQPIEVPVGSTPATGTTPPEEVTISFIHMNDLHANLTSHAEAFRISDSENIDVVEAGGISRIATKIKQIRTENPDNTVLMNIGDTFHGGGEALFSNGNAIVAPVNALNIDIGVPGNWDFAYGPIVTNARFGALESEEIERPNYELLAANATYRIPPAMAGNSLAENAVQSAFNYSAGDAFLPATKIIERSGINIGFIGLTSDIVEKMHPVLAFNIDFTQGESAYISLINQQAASLKENGADIVVVMSELGLQKDWALANKLEKDVVQVFFSAHTHEITEQALVADNGTLVVESGNDSYLGQLDITFSSGDITQTLWQLHRLDNNVMEDADMLAQVASIRAPFLEVEPNIEIPSVSIANGMLDNLIPKPSSQKLNYSLDKVIHTSSLALDRYNSLESNFNNFYTDLLRFEQNTAVAMTAGFRFSSVIIPNEDAFSGDVQNYVWQSETPEILTGDITVKDVYRFFPAPYGIANASISIAGLKAVIEQNLEEVYSTDVFEQKGGWAEGFSGLNLTLDLSESTGNRIIELSFTDSGVIPQDTDVITITGCVRPFDFDAETTLCSYSGFSNVTNIINPVTGDDYASADYFIDQLMTANPVLERILMRNNLNDISGVTQWPQAAYYQPLEGIGQ